MTQLSEHFTLEEFTYSDTAKAKGISNQPTETHLNTLKHTCVYCLEPLRALLNEIYDGCTITITSGYRSQALNNAIPGSAKTSQHMTGEAADLQAYKKVNGVKTAITYTDLFNHIKEWVKADKLCVDQCILEQSGGATWVHVSHSASGNTKDRKEFLKYSNGVYTNA